MAPLSVLEVHQMCGRAGRPGLDPYGEALLLAKSHDELDELFDRYIWTEPEAVRSKLAAEPALRTHLLATVASGFASSREGLLEFLDQTLYATQTTEGGRLERVTDDMLDYLEVNDFLERDGDDLAATSLGHTVSRLYLDPMSAAEIVDGLQAAESRPSALGLFHLVSRTPDMYELYLRSGDREEYTMLANERETELLGAKPSEFEARWEDWLSALKTARLLEDWASELDESEITERYSVGPGDLRGKVDTAEWLLSAAERLAGELGLEWAPAVREARTARRQRHPHRTHRPRGRARGGPQTRPPALRGRYRDPGRPPERRQIGRPRARSAVAGRPPRTSSTTSGEPTSRWTTSRPTGRWRSWAKGRTTSRTSGSSDDGRGSLMEARRGRSHRRRRGRVRRRGSTGSATTTAVRSRRSTRAPSSRVRISRERSNSPTGRASVARRSRATVASRSCSTPRAAAR